MKIRFGYVALSKTLEKVTASSLMTYTHYKKLGHRRGNEKLHKIILSNFSDLENLLLYNKRNDISFYRMTSRLIPLLGHNDVKINLIKYKAYFHKVGLFIKKNKMRIDTHPDQFCVLNSVREDVVLSSINILKNHQNMFDLMNYDGKMVVHVGSSAGGKREGMKRFIENFKNLDASLKKMILLENDDKVYNISNVLKICEELNIPMVLDYHHHLCNNTGQQIEKYIERIFNTWGNDIPKIHFSSSKSKKEKRAHNDYINVLEFIKFIDKIKFMNKDFDVMIEAKMKDEAMFRLIRQLKYLTLYKIEGTTLYIE